ncbi:hypothetical protein EON65_04830 [archaeon]|nr:MAG: hypothetical protein EON65_04830 [archaeon]
MSDAIVCVEEGTNQVTEQTELGIELTSAVTQTQPTLPSLQPGTSSPIKGPNGNAFNPDRSFMKSLSSHRTVRISLHWEHINLSVVTKDTKQSKFLRPVYKKKQILRDISGHAKSGELLAIMGPTGTIC